MDQAPKVPRLRFDTPGWVRRMARAWDQRLDREAAFHVWARAVHDRLVRDHRRYDLVPREILRDLYQRGYPMRVAVEILRRNQ